MYLKYIYATSEFMLKYWKTSLTLDWCWRFSVANIWAQTGSTDSKLFLVMWVGSMADHYDIWWIRYAGLCLHYCPNIKWLERFSLDRSIEQDVKMCIAIIQTIHGRWSLRPDLKLDYLVVWCLKIRWSLLCVDLKKWMALCKSWKSCGLDMKRLSLIWREYHSMRKNNLGQAL